MPSPENRVIIAGGGNVGMALALALRMAAPALAVTIVDATAPDAEPKDLRSLAIGAASRRMLERLGVWSKVESEAQPIVEMVIGDTRPEDVGRPVFLTFSGTVNDGEPFAHMVPSQVLTVALRQACAAVALDVQAPMRVTDFQLRSQSIEAKVGALDGHDSVWREGALLVAADGARSRLRALAGISSVAWGYGQSGIVVTVEHERPHEGRARQDFLPAGPFAVLPLKGNRSSLVWTDRTEVAPRLALADRLVFQAELELRFGHELGWVRPVGPVETFPLGFSLARRFVARRLALCGDAGHVTHPIAGQGLNLGFQDAAALAEVVVDAARLGLDFGSDEVLRRYESWRRRDVVAMGLVTDGLNRMFSNNSAPLRLARDIGLGLVDRLPGLKTAFINRAAGMEPGAPRLLRGEAI